jgi:cytoskeleton protein RodZ
MTFAELGEEIRDRREKAGMTVSDVAARTKVSSRTLYAIEAGDMEALPYAVYAKGFIRSYAFVVGFSPEEISAHLEELFPATALGHARLEQIARLHAAPPHRMRRKILLFLFCLCLLAALGAGIRYIVLHHGTTIWDFVKQPFSAVTTPASSPSADYIATIALAGFSSEEEDGAAARLHPAPENVSLTKSSPHAPQALSAEELPREEKIPQDSAGPYAWEIGSDIQEKVDNVGNVRVEASKECWIGFRADGGRFGHLTLHPGQKRLFTFQNYLDMRLGNAGGVRIFYNDQDMGILGLPGEVRLVRFPPDVRASNGGR